MAYLYQEVMKVPGLSGTWQQRNAELYKKLGAPLGGYTGSYDQNIWLLNQLKKNDYFKGGLPGSKPAAPSNPLQNFTAPLNNVQADNRVFSQDVMPLDTWRGAFDTWTQNFVDSYIRPEWEENVYNPAMKEMGNAMNQANQNIHGSGAWRSSMAHNQMNDMAQDSMRREAQMRQGFNDQTVNIRDTMNQAWADPLYQSNMSRFVTAPWRDMNVGQEISNTIGGLGGQAIQGVQNSLQNQGINYSTINNLGDAMNNISGWNPSTGGNATLRDWSTPGSGTDIFKQYLRPLPTNNPPAAPGGQMYQTQPIYQAQPMPGGQMYQTQPINF
jgi:hypothetical protein